MTLEHLHLTPTRRQRLESHATRIAEKLQVDRQTVFDKIAALLRPHATNYQLTEAIGKVEKELDSGQDA